MVVDYFDIGKTPCKAYQPDGGEATKAVLAIHGFAGDKESSAIAALAKATCPGGAAVYCFDFPAHGEHPSDELTLEACKGALADVASRVGKLHPSAAKAVFATSFGGYMALLNLDMLGEALGPFSLVLRAPAVRMSETFERCIVGNQLDRLGKAGSIECGFDRKITVRSEFLDELRANDACKPCQRQLMIVHGDADDIVTVADIDSFVALNPQTVLVRIPGADHRFKGDGHLEAAIGVAAEYIAHAD